jgi:hypothetical protein
MSEQNSTPYSGAPQNVPFFSDGNVLRDIGKIEARLDGHDRDLKDCKDEIGKLRDAVAKLKEWKAFIIGGAIVVAAIASWITNLLLK